MPDQRKIIPSFGEKKTAERCSTPQSIIIYAFYTEMMEVILSGGNMHGEIVGINGRTWWWSVSGLVGGNYSNKRRRKPSTIVEFS